MKAFAQQLSGLVRVGDETDAWLQPFDYMVGYSSVEHGECMVHGLVSEDGKFNIRHARAIIAELRRLGFRTIEWQRAKKKRRTFTVRLKE